MATGLKQLAKETGIYGVSSIVGKFLNYLLVPMYMRVFAGTGEFGIYTNLYAMAALLLVFLTYGMETAFFRFINKKEEQQPMRVYATTLFSVGGTSLFFILCVFLFLTPLSNALGYDAYPEFLAIMLSVTAVDAFLSIPFAYLRYKRKALRFAGIKLVNVFLNIGLNLFFFLACPWIYQRLPEAISWFYDPSYGVGYAFLANLMTTATVLLLLLPDIFEGLRVKPNLPLLKQMLRYAFPILILGVAGILNQTADKLLFPFLFDDKEYAMEQLGIYGACFRMAAIMIMFIQAFRYAYEPFIFAKHREAEDSQRSYVEAMKYFIIFALLIFLGVMFYIDLLKMLATPDYYDGIQVIPIVMMGELFFGIYFNLSFWYKLTDQTKWGAYFSIIGCVTTMALIILFVPTYGFVACAWASFAGNLVMMLLSFVIGQKKFPINYDLKSAFTYFALASILYVVAMYVPIESLVWRLIYRTVWLAVFVFYIIKKDLPLKELPYIGRYFK